MTWAGTWGGTWLGLWYARSPQALPTSGITYLIPLDDRTLTWEAQRRLFAIAGELRIYHSAHENRGLTVAQETRRAEVMEELRTMAVAEVRIAAWTASRSSPACRP